VKRRYAKQIAVERDINSWNEGIRFGLQKYSYLLKKFNLLPLFFNNKDGIICLRYKKRIAEKSIQNQLALIVAFVSTQR
jgi:hypothetical protein